MSHFTVLVIGNDPEKQLAPYHEFECTGNDDKYIQDIDKTEEIRKEYQSRKTKRLQLISFGESAPLEDPFDNKFFREPTSEEIERIGSLAGSFGSVAEENGKPHFVYEQRDLKDGRGRRIVIPFVPEGYKEVEVLESEIKTFEEFIRYWQDIEDDDIVDFDKGEVPDTSEKHKYGYMYIKNGQPGYISRTNPNSKWDWYQIGGRWNGFFQLKQTPLLGNLSDTFNELGFTINEVQTLASLRRTNPSKFEKIITTTYYARSQDILEAISQFEKKVYPDAVVGEPGVFGDKRKDYTGRADQAYKKDIDFDAMIEQARNKAGDDYDKVLDLFNGTIPSFRSWKEVLTDNESFKDIEEKRNFYNAQEPMRRIHYASWDDPSRTEEEKNFFTWVHPEDFLCTREDYMKKAESKAFQTFALIKDSQWYEKGSMGWWGVSSETEEESRAWNESFYDKWIKPLPDDTLLTIVDCHI